MKPGTQNDKLAEILRIVKDIKVSIAQVNATRLEPIDENSTSNNNNAVNDRSHSSRISSPQVVIPKQHISGKSEREKGFWEQLSIPDRIQAGIALLALCAVVFSALTFRLSRNTSEAQLRAWVTVADLSLASDLSTASISAINLKAKNSGQTPALDAQWHMDSVETGIQGGRCPVKTPIKIPYHGGAPIGPGDVISAPNLEIFTNAQACLDDLHRGVATLKIQGNLTYRDIFGKQHFTNFCSQYEGISSHLLTACPEHNDMN